MAAVRFKSCQPDTGQRVFFSLGFFISEGFDANSDANWWRKMTP
jgi:hypothetical protein